MFLRHSLLLASVLAWHPASAEDLGVTINWSGVYVGADVGKAFTSTNFSSDFAFLTPDSYSESGLAGGLHVGYGEQIGKLYLGVEGAWTGYSNAIVGDFLTNAPLFGPPADPSHCSRGALCSPRTVFVTELTESFETQIRSIASFKARLGYSVGRFLPYLATGVAGGTIPTRYLAETNLKMMRGIAVLSQSRSGYTVDDSEFAIGYTLGGGMEYALTSKVSIRGEYAFTDLGKRSFAHEDGSGSESFRTQLQEARLGISFRF